MCLVKSGVNILSVILFCPRKEKNCLYLLAVHACNSTEKLRNLFNNFNSVLETLICAQTITCIYFVHCLSTQFFP